ncbi:MAG: cyclophilin-like family protein, partial [Thermofilum sp.]
DEIYFRTPVKVAQEVGSEVVELGDVAYWPPGEALCIFFGPTPVSRPGEIRPASPVNVIGKVKGDLEKLRKVKQGEKVRVEFRP